MFFRRVTEVPDTSDHDHAYLYSDQGPSASPYGPTQSPGSSCTAPGPPREASTEAQHTRLTAPRVSGRAAHFEECLWVSHHLNWQHPGILSRTVVPNTPPKLEKHLVLMLALLRGSLICPEKYSEFHLSNREFHTCAHTTLQTTEKYVRGTTQSQEWPSGVTSRKALSEENSFGKTKMLIDFVISPEKSSPGSII